MKAYVGMLAATLLVIINTVALQAQEPVRPTPQDFIMLELAIGTLGAISTPVAALSAIGIVCYLESVESCANNRVKRFLMIPLFVAAMAGPGLGAALGVWWVGSQQGVQGNVTMAFVGGLLGEALAILMMPIVSVHDITSSASISGLEITGVIYLSWFFIAPAAGATWGYNLGAKMASGKPSPSAQHASVAKSLRIPLIALRF